MKEGGGNEREVFSIASENPPTRIVALDPKFRNRRKNDEMTRHLVCISLDYIQFSIF